MAKYDAVAVFTTRLQDDGTFLPFVYQELDRAVALVEKGQAPFLIVCGSHWAGEKFRGVRECDVARTYINERYPHVAPKLLTEGRSTTVPENWLFMKLKFPKIRKIHQVTIAPLLPRMEFCGDWIYGNAGKLSFEALPWPDSDFSHEPKLLEIMQCIFRVQNRKPRGDHTFLLYRTGESCWLGLWNEHASCRDCFPG